MTRTGAFRVEGRAMKRPARRTTRTTRLEDTKRASISPGVDTDALGRPEAVASEPRASVKPLFALDWEGAVLDARLAVARICAERFGAAFGSSGEEGTLAGAWLSLASDPRRRGSGRMTLLSATLRFAASSQAIGFSRRHYFRALADAIDARLAMAPDASADELLRDWSGPGPRSRLDAILAWEGSVESALAKAGPFAPFASARRAISALSRFGDLALVGAEEGSRMLALWEAASLPGRPSVFGGYEAPRIRFERAAAGR
ncbi:MAG: hypothetical protein Q8M76_18040, partial [Spirochaetaceae bacterium]|nr:hypothetical protein [Spirochaetaceae bacterium]